LKELPKIQDGLSYESYMKLFDLMKNRHWLEDESKATYDLWNLCSSIEKQDLIYELLCRFEFITSRELNKLCQNIANHITQSWNLTNIGTKFVATSKDQRPDGSQFIIQALKNNFANMPNWSESNFVNNLNTIGQVAYQLRDNQKIILIDDFIGTGKTILRKIKWLQDKISKKKKTNVCLYVVSIAIMKSAVDDIKTLVFDCYASLILNKGISDYYPQKIKTMLELEQYLASHYKGESLPSLGYGKSESLFAIEGINVPNNVFPIFWWPVLNDFSIRDTIFKRIR
jgi:hypothetical protein